MILKKQNKFGSVCYTRDSVLIAKEWLTTKGRRASFGIPYVNSCVLEGEKIVFQLPLPVKMGEGEIVC